MSSPEPANGAFFADPDKPEAQDAQPAPEPVVTEAPETPSSTHESAAGPAAAMIDVPLGTLIFRAGLLGEEQLEDALREGMSTGKRLGEVLIARGWLQERDLGRLLAGQKGLPFVEVSGSEVDPAALEKLSEEDAKLQVALPLRYEGGQLVVAVADPSNELMLENLRRTIGAPPKLVVAPYDELVKAIGEAYANPQPVAPQEPEAVVPEPETPQPETDDQPQADVEPAPAVRPLPIVVPLKKSDEPEAPQLATEDQPQAEVEPAPASRPLPIVLATKTSAAEPETPQPEAQAQPQTEVERAPLIAPVVHAVEQAPAAQPSTPELQPAVEPAPEEPSEPEATADQQPVAPELILELPPDWPSAGEEPAEAPATPAPSPEAPAPEPPAQEEPAALTTVVLRLTDGTTLEVGTFQTVAEAAAEAQEVVIEIAAADRNGGWPFFAQRYLRPDLIVSVDLVEQSSVTGDGLRRSQR